MATRLNYSIGIVRQLMADLRGRMRPGGLAGSLPKAARDSQFFIVTGAGRSGTSAVARVLHESGVRIGRNLAPASDVNAEGFYEDLDVVLLHERMLTELGMAGMWQSQRWPWRSTVRAVAQRYRADMAALIAGAADGWKDPRFSITLEAWLPLLPLRPKVIICLRSPEAYVESVMRVYGLIDRRAVERQWARHYRRLLDVIRDYRLEAICIEYDTLVERTEETVAALASFVGRPLRGEYVSPPLRRHGAYVAPRYRELYEEVLRLAPQDLRHGIPAARDEHHTPRAPSDRYAERAESVIARVRAAKAAWEVEVCMPEPAADATTRARSSQYQTLVVAAQEELAGLEPPPELAADHELTVREVNVQRMIVELMLAALSGDAIDTGMLKAAVRAWRRFGGRKAFRRASG